MTPDNASIYRERMREIWRRSQFIAAFQTIPGLGMYNWTRIESICLQIRMILEKIAFACLVANGDNLDTLPSTIKKAYDAETILRRLDKIVPDCYPRPLVLLPGTLESTFSEIEVPHGEYRGELVERPQDEWLSREEFRGVYGRLGQVLHARNPLGTFCDITYFEQMAPEWINKIVRLVTHHRVAISNDNMMYIVQIPPSGDVSITPFEQLEAT